MIRGAVTLRAGEVHDDDIALSVAARILGRLAGLAYDAHARGEYALGDLWLYLVVFTAFSLNAFYLYWHPNRPRSRLWKLLQLWLDAKEHALKEKARQSSN